MVYKVLLNLNQIVIIKNVAKISKVDIKKIEVAKAIRAGIKI